MTADYEAAKKMIKRNKAMFSAIKSSIGRNKKNGRLPSRMRKQFRMAW